MSKLLVNAVTVSCSFSDKEYGKGSEYFQNVSSRVPLDHQGIPLEELNSVVDESLEMFFTEKKVF